jgi:hypothetical protein
VSRALKRLEQRGQVACHRGRIELHFAPGRPKRP